MGGACPVDEGRVEVRSARVGGPDGPKIGVLSWLAAPAVPDHWPVTSNAIRIPIL